MRHHAAVPPEEPAKQPQESKRTEKARTLAWRLESLASGFVALLALFISAYTVYINRQQMKAQTWPRLVERTDGSLQDGRWSLFLRNNGVAPAEIRAVRVSIGGVDVPTWRAYARRIAEMRGVVGRGEFSFAHEGALVGEVIAPGQEITVFTTGSLSTVAHIEAVSDQGDLDICYCSMLDDCWEYRDDGDNEKTTRVVPRCAPYPVPFVGFDNEDRAAEHAYIAQLARDGVRPADAGAD
jgi:hypothetical protein